MKYADMIMLQKLFKEDKPEKKTSEIDTFFRMMKRLKKFEELEKKLKEEEDKKKKEKEHKKDDKKLSVSQLTGIFVLSFFVVPPVYLYWMAKLITSIQNLH